MNSEVQKAEATRVRAWLRENKLFFAGCVILVAYFSFIAVVSRTPARILTFLFWCLLVAYLVNLLLSAQRKLLGVCSVLLNVAFLKCCCAGKGGCPICESRRVLREQFPRELQSRLYAHVFDGRPVPEGLTSYLTATELTWLQKYFEAHPAKPQSSPPQR